REPRTVLACTDQRINRTVAPPPPEDLRNDKQSVVPQNHHCRRIGVAQRRPRLRSHFKSERPRPDPANQPQRNQRNTLPPGKPLNLIMLSKVVWHKGKEMAKIQIPQTGPRNPDLRFQSATFTQKNEYQKRN